MALNKNEQIKKTLLETRLRRTTQRCLVYEFKINTKKLTKKDFEQLKFYFVQSRWLYNYLLGLEDINSFDTKTRIIYSFDKDETRNVWASADTSSGLKYKKVTNDDSFTPVKSDRSIYLTYNDITREEQLTVDVVVRSVQIAEQSKAKLMNTLLVSEDEMNEAQAINSSLGIDDTDIEAQLFTANELRVNRINE